MLDENKRLAKRALDEVFSRGNLQTIDEIFHSDFINHEAGPHTPSGRDGLKVTVPWLRSSFSDLRYEVEDAIAEGDRVVLRVISRGRQTGEFMGFPATGKEFAAKQIHVYRIVGGKILEHWAVRDDLGQGIQLGLIPASQAMPSSSAPVAPQPIDSAFDTRLLGRPLVSTAQVPVGGGVILSEKHVVVTQSEAGRFRAFTSTCTHLGCTVAEVSEGRIKCPCHGSQFAIYDGSVVHGPAARALPAYEVKVVGGEVTIAGKDQSGAAPPTAQ